MITEKVNKRFNTREELEEYEKKVAEEFIVMMIVRAPQEVGKDEIYGVDEIWHFGKRG